MPETELTKEDEDAISSLIHDPFFSESRKTSTDHIAARLRTLAELEAKAKAPTNPRDPMPSLERLMTSGAWRPTETYPQHQIASDFDSVREGLRALAALRGRETGENQMNIKIVKFSGMMDKTGVQITHIPTGIVARVSKQRRGQSIQEMVKLAMSLLHSRLATEPAPAQVRKYDLCGADGVPTVTDANGTRIRGDNVTELLDGRLEMLRSKLNTKE